MGKFIVEIKTPYQFYRVEKIVGKKPKLIDPERTCRNVAKERGCWSVEFLCSECGHEAYHYDYKPAVGERCIGCGAKVVE